MTVAGAVARRFARILALAALCAGISHAQPPSAPEPGVHIRALIPAAQLVGAGRYTWFGFHAYDAALYADGGRYTDKAGFALELTYARNFKGSAIAERSIGEIGKLGFGQESELDQWRSTLAQIFPDVKPGDRLTGVSPALGPAQFFHNGRAIGSLDDDKLRRAFFAIWLDARTSAPDLRARLLGLPQGVR